MSKMFTLFLTTNHTINMFKIKDYKFKKLICIIMEKYEKGEIYEITKENIMFYPSYRNCFKF
jgi:hypothetical protein